MIFNIHKLSVQAAIVLVMLTISLTAYSASTAEYIKEAHSYMEEGKYRSAVIQLKNALQQDPDSAKARYLLGYVYLKAGDPASAQTELSRAIELGFDKDKAVVDLGKAYLMQGQADKVLSDIDASDKASPTVKAAVIAIKGDAYLSKHQEAQARNSFQKALKIDPDSVEGLLGSARMALMDNDSATASRLVDKAIKVDDNSVDAWQIKGEILRMEGELDKAEFAYNRALEIEPSNLAAHMGRAAALIADKKFDKAKEDIKAVRHLQPNSPMANYLQAVVDYSQKDMSGAQDALQSVLRAAPNHLPSILLMGTINYAQGHLEQAQERLSRYVNAVPQHLPARKLLAATYIKLRQPGDAIKLLTDKSVQGDMNTDAQLVSLLGSAYMMKGDIVQGTKYLERAAKLAPDVAAIRTQLALSQLAKGDTKHAITQLESAVDLGQGLFQADILLVLAHMQQGDYDKALDAAEALRKKTPESPVPENLIGAAYLGKKDMVEARKHFEKALKLESDFSIAEMNLVRMDLEAGKTDHAETHLNHILSYDSGNVDALIALAGIEQRRGNTTKMVEWLARANDKNPTAIRPALLLANYYLQAGDTLKALTIMRSIHDAHPDNPEIMRVLGISQLENGETASAIVTFNKLAAAVPKSPEAHYRLAQAYMKREDYQSAEDNLHSALKLSPKFLSAEALLAELKIRTGKKKEAFSLASDIQKSHPDLSSGYELEGDVYISDKDYGQAAKAYAKAFDKHESGLLAMKLSNLYRASNQKDKVYSPLLSWLKGHPDDVAVRRELALAYQGAGKKDKAITQYEMLIEKQPKDPVVLNNLAWLYDEKGDARSLDYAQKAYDLRSDSPEIADTLGWMLLKHNENKKALVLLQDAVTHAPEIAEIRYHLAVALNKVGRNDEARSELERVLSENQHFSEIESAKALLAKINKQ